MIGKAINEFTSMARSGFESWQQSIFLQHASDDVKRQLADAQLKKRSCVWRKKIQRKMRLLLLCSSQALPLLPLALSLMNNHIILY